MVDIMAYSHSSGQSGLQPLWWTVWPIDTLVDTLSYSHSGGQTSLQPL